MTTGFRDIHAHFVYGVDDGAKSLQDMQAMLDEAYLGGIKVLYATSHSTPGIHHFPEDVYTAHLNEAKAYCAERGYDIRLYSGTEILYTPAFKNYLERKPLRTLENSDCVLIEFVPDVSFREIETAVTMVEEAGYTPILAHIERY
ncbi:MAG: tyrosine protein phosphatase, partial [Clostridia bacterium]|nr:tyrosine protein phosphatase [Clostridia bacterium]